MISAAKSLETLVALWDAASTLLTSSEVEKAMDIGKDFPLGLQMADCLVLGQGQEQLQPSEKMLWSWIHKNKQHA